MSDVKELIVPPLGESVSEATIGRWLKSAGDAVAQDETIVELETEKVTLEVNAPEAGTLTEITAQEGSTVAVGDVIGKIGAGAQAAPAPAAAPQQAEETTREETAEAKPDLKAIETPTSPAPSPEFAPTSTPPGTVPIMSPAAQKIAAEGDVPPAEIPASGKDGRVTKQDVLNFMKTGETSTPTQDTQPTVTTGNTAIELDLPPAPQTQAAPQEERVKMSRLRQTIASRLKEAQNTAAMLTTFNEVDMTEVMRIRSDLKERFEKKHGVRLGFMSFFVKAAEQALREVPSVNAQIDGDEIIYKNHYDIGVAVSAPQGLVVPVVRDVASRSFAGIEQEINDLALRARDGKLSVAELTGGTFTITNGGVFGSLMSTPILNPPQSGILGMHKIQKRPMVVGDEVKVRPMMYIALTYDHRIIDGREAVTFLVKIKECIENPEHILLGV
ncbi:MAG: 2-oxoglutarate dehydrogenase complex dihydrolipoyllysine-residue succinyltransferase [Alphaproteobacteria bacterium]